MQFLLWVCPIVCSGTVLYHPDKNYIRALGCDTVYPGTWRSGLLITGSIVTVVATYV